MIPIRFAAWYDAINKDRRQAISKIYYKLSTRYHCVTLIVYLPKEVIQQESFEKWGGLQPVDFLITGGFLFSW